VIAAYSVNGKYTIEYTALAAKIPGSNEYLSARTIWPMRANSTGR
jgi:hypothetical protein